MRAPTSQESTDDPLETMFPNNYFRSVDGTHAQYCQTSASCEKIICLSRADRADAGRPMSIFIEQLKSAAKSLCVKIGTAYQTQSINNAEHMLVSYRHDHSLGVATRSRPAVVNHQYTICSFVLYDSLGPAIPGVAAMHLSLICSQPGNGNIMKYGEKLLRQLGIHSIMMEAVETAQKYYIHYGYQYIYTKGENGEDEPLGNENGKFMVKRNIGSDVNIECNIQM